MLHHFEIKFITFKDNSFLNILYLLRSNYPLNIDMYFWYSFSLIQSILIFPFWNDLLFRNQLEKVNCSYLSKYREAPSMVLVVFQVKHFSYLCLDFCHSMLKWLFHTKVQHPNLIFIQSQERLAIVLLLIICLTPNCFFNLKKKRKVWACLLIRPHQKGSK